MTQRYSITDPYSLRALCIRKRWFTCGTNEQYEKLFYANQNGYTLDQIATIIWVCSDAENRQEIVDALSDIKNYTESDTIIKYLTDTGESITECYTQEDKTDAVFKDHFFTELSNLICFSDCSGYMLQQATFRGRAVHYSGWRPEMVFAFEDDDGALIWTGSFPEWEH